MTKTISLNQAATRALTRHPYFVLTNYDLGVVVYKTIREGHLAGRPLRLRSKAAARRHYTQVRSYLLDSGLLKAITGVRSNSAFTLLSAGRDVTAEEIVCHTDPFCYLSHLSAMAMHGLTDRLPKTIFITSPSDPHWNGYANEKMHKELGEHWQGYSEAGFPVLRRPDYRKINGSPVNIAYRKHFGAYRKFRPLGLRVSTIGRTFLDMMRDPDLCGGIHHVLGIYQDHAKDNLQLIINDIDRHGTAIDKVRVGYVLSERMGISHPTVEGWRQFVQRGGSRLLYAKNEYSPNYSADWCLSLNHE